MLADASLCLARGEAMQRRQRNDPDTPVEAYLERCSLKTGKLFEAACSLGSGGTLGRFGLNLGIAFQIADDILDCSGDTIETGKVAGTDLREGTPTLPLLLAAREDDAVRAALAGGPIEGALVRVAATGALERSRQVALDYAREARESLNGGVHREELESLADAVVEPRSTDGILARTSTLEPIREKIEAGERLDFEDGLALLETDDLLGLGELADRARRLRGGTDEVYFVQNLYLNQTNVCRVKCKFCAFAATQKQEHAYTISTRRWSRTPCASGS